MQQQNQWQGEDRRRKAGNMEKPSAAPGMSNPAEQRDEQQRRAQQLHEDQNKH